MPGASEDAGVGPDHLEFLLLGPLTVRRNGIDLPLGPPKQRAVLALLALNANHVVSTDRLIDELWGDAPPETARSALQVYVAGLRKAFGNGDATLRTRTPGYVLEVDAGALDIDRFEALRSEARAASSPAARSALLHDALALWRDTPLSEFDGEPFAAAAATRLEEERLAALEERVDADLALGRHEPVVSELERLVRQHPYRERLRGQLMRALYAAGRQHEALEVYRDGRRRLTDDLGMEPGPELRRLERAILEHDPELVPPPLEAESGAPDEPSRRSLWRWTPLAATAAVLAVAVAVLLVRSDPAVVVPPNSVAVIDPSTNRVVDVIPVGIRPGPIAAGHDVVWVGNLEDRTLTKIDARARAVVGAFSLDRKTPTGLTVDRGIVWVAHGLLGQISLVDAQFGQISRVLHVAEKGPYSPTGSVASGKGAIWAVFGDLTLARLRNPGGVVTGTTLAGNSPVGVAVGYRSVWVANSGDATVQRFNPETFGVGPIKTFTVASRPGGIAIGEGGVWVTSTGDDLVIRIDPNGGSTLQIAVGGAPTAVAVGEDAVWVANTKDRTISRVDPEKGIEVATIELGNPPAGMAFAGDLLWVTVQAP